MSDSEIVAKTFASGSVQFAQQRKDKRPNALQDWICTLEMQDSNWIRAIDKAWIPFNNLARLKNSVNDPIALRVQENMITSLGQTPERTVRFSACEYSFILYSMSFTLIYVY